MSVKTTGSNRVADGRRAIKPYGWIEGTHRKHFDDLTSLAAMICRTPMAWIVLIENAQCRVVAHFGEENDPTEEVTAFCLRVAEEGKLFLEHRPHGQKFRAGVPMLSMDGRTEGCLCVMDVVPRVELTEQQVEALWALSRQGQAQVELRRSLTKLARAGAGQTRAEMELASERNLLRSIIDSVPDNLYLKDTEGRYLLDNKAHQRFLGKRHFGEIEGRTVFDFFPREQAEKFDNDDKAVMRWGQALFNLEEVAVDQAGLRHDLLTSKIPMRNEEGDLTGLICISHDITGHKQTERAVALLAAIVEDTSDAIYSKSVDGIILNWNAAAERMYGFTANEIVGRHVSQLYPADRLSESERILSQIVQGQRVATFETVRTRKDGGRIDVSVTVSPLRDSLGKIVGASVVGRDITDRKRAARALMESEERFRLMIEGVKDYAIIMLHARGHITGWNAGAERIFGYTAQEVLGEAVTRLSRPEDVEAELLPQELVEAEREGRSEWEGWRVRKNGNQFFAHVITTALRDEEGHLCWFAQVTKDITELKQKTEDLEDSNRLLVQTLDQLHRTQQELVQAERLRALGQMATGIAHDFNNALAPILGFSELLLIRPDDLNDIARVTRYLDLIHDNAEEAAKIVNRLRDFYRYRDAAEVLSPVNLDQLARKVVEMTRTKWQNEALAEGVTITVVTDLQPVPAVEGKESELIDALTGIIINAVDALVRKRQPGRLSVSTRLEGEHVAIAIEDTGSGMTEEVRQHCFEPFYTTKTTHGSGLGLALVYGVVNRHKGMVTLESEEGIGTTITIRLPLKAISEPVAPIVPVLPAADKGSIRILVVDDDPTVREVTTEFLKEDDRVVDQAGSGAEALEKLQVTAYDLVITDKAMPGMSGCQLAVAIKQAHPELPVILLTGFGDMMNAAGEKPPGIDEVLGKPLSMARLQEAVAKYCRR